LTKRIQVSGVTVNNFSGDTSTYVVKSLNGKYRSYFVVIDTVPASPLDAIDSIYLGSPRILGSVKMDTISGNFYDTAFLSLPFGFSNKKIYLQVKLSIINNYHILNLILNNPLKIPFLQIVEKSNHYRFLNLQLKQLL